MNISFQNRGHYEEKDMVTIFLMKRVDIVYLASKRKVQGNLRPAVEEGTGDFAQSAGQSCFGSLFSCESARFLA
jgi:hypothetical protein